ncbi:uncharacterized protein LOC129716767 [Wyeomyia smithii]|uniref:uncharacterized protein LOC129716767 n=1 Tax=Wyeomyia smithii TaxID=174621 RepID=UPI002467BB51|nr:uncharacterized protein LOC129716767 [Wyeomyia smithii]
MAPTPFEELKLIADLLNGEQEEFRRNQRICIRVCGEATGTLDREGEAGSVHNEYVFTFTAIFFQRFFKSQLRPKEWTRLTVYGDTVTDIVDFLCDVAKVKIERQVIFDNDIPKWSENATPTVNDANDFVSLQDTTKKKCYSIDSLTARILRGWKDKQVRVYVYVWSMNVETSSQHQAILRKLLSPQNTDKAGAHSIRDDSALADELRDNHTHLEGHYSSWLLWANFIHSSPAHKHDELKRSATPPLQLSKYFRWVATSEQSRLKAVHKGLIVAQHNNSGWLREIGNVKQVVINAKML